MTQADRIAALLALCQSHPRTCERARLLLQEHNAKLIRIAESGQMAFAKEDWALANRRTFAAMLIFNLEISEVEIPEKLRLPAEDESHD